MNNTKIQSTADRLEAVEKIARAAADVCCLVNLAATYAADAEQGDAGSAHMLAVLVRSLKLQACELHRVSDAEWMAAYDATKQAAHDAEGAESSCLQTGA